MGRRMSGHAFAVSMLCGVLCGALGGATYGLLMVLRSSPDPETGELVQMPLGFLFVVAPAAIVAGIMASIPSTLVGAVMLGHARIGVVWPWLALATVVASGAMSLMGADPFSAIVLVATVYTIGCLVGMTCAPGVFAPGMCARCGYDLRGVACGAGGVCPECGPERAETM